MLKNIKGAIFDMDGTLVDSLMLWDVIWKKLGKKFLNDETFAPTVEDDKAVRTKTLKDGMEYIHSIYQIGQSGEDLLNEANAIMENFYAHEVELKKDVLDFLEYVQKKGIKMCIASGTDIRLIKIVVERCNLGKYFSNILSCAEIGKGKDQPDIYLMALNTLGTEIMETCVFEDSHIALETASKLGMKTVGIYDKYNYGQDEMQKIATVYLSKEDTMKKLIDNF